MGDVVDTLPQERTGVLTGALSPGGVEGAPAQDTTPWCSRGRRGARDTAPTLDRVLVLVPPVGVDVLSRCRGLSLECH